MSFREIIQREPKRQGLSGYALAKRVAPNLSMRMVQAYLSGSNDMVGERLALLCEALGLELRLAPKRTQQPRKARHRKA